jgi:hypothetical protein
MNNSSLPFNTNRRYDYHLPKAYCGKSLSCEACTSVSENSQHMRHYLEYVAIYAEQVEQPLAVESVAVQLVNYQDAVAVRTRRTCVGIWLIGVQQRHLNHAVQHTSNTAKYDPMNAISKRREVKQLLNTSSPYAINMLKVVSAEQKTNDSCCNLKHCTFSSNNEADEDPD